MGKNTFKKSFINECQEALKKEKVLLLTKLEAQKETLSKQAEHSKGDEADQVNRLLTEKEALSLNQRITYKLKEINLALKRIEDGSYGFCAETGEAIEEKRLLSIPWTTLSIEGAELMESNEQKIYR